MKWNKRWTKLKEVRPAITPKLVEEMAEVGRSVAGMIHDCSVVPNMNDVKALAEYAVRIAEYAVRIAEDKAVQIRNKEKKFTANTTYETI
jgi:hypothetical protein